MDYSQLAKNYFPDTSEPSDHMATDPNSFPSSYGDNPLVETMSDQEMYTKFSQELRNTERSMTEEQLLGDSNFLEASKVMWFKENNGEPKLNDEEMSKWGLDYISSTSYNLSRLGATAYNVSDFDSKQQLSLAYMMDSLEDKDITWGGFTRAMGAMAQDPTTYLGVGAFTKIMGRGGLSLFKSNLNKAIATSAFESGAYAGTEEAFMQEIDEETLGTEKDPLNVAIHALVGGTIGAGLPLVPKATVGLGRGVKKMAQEKLDTPIGDMVTGTMRAVPEEKVPTFKTSDGYTLKKTTEDGKIVWTDGDLIFDDKGGIPIDTMGDKLEGVFK